jgi:hypothetical protein
MNLRCWLTSHLCPCCLRPTCTLTSMRCHRHSLSETEAEPKGLAWAQQLGSAGPPKRMRGFLGHSLAPFGPVHALPMRHVARCCAQVLPMGEAERSRAAMGAGRWRRRLLLRALHSWEAEAAR